MADTTAEGAQVALSLPPAPETAPDDLTRIKGIGKAVAVRLNEVGLTHFRQIAELDSDQADALNEQLDLRNSIDRNDWIGQASELAPADDAGFVEGDPFAAMKEPRETRIGAPREAVSAPRRGPGKNLDRSRYFSTIHPPVEGRRYIQDGAYYDGGGGYMGPIDYKEAPVRGRR